MKRIVHISGYSLAETSEDAFDQRDQKVTGKFNDWETVCWGNSILASLGRIPMGLWAAHQFKADKIIWSTGCSRSASGEYEATVMYQRAHDSFKTLLTMFPQRFNTSMWKTELEYQRWLERTAIIDSVSTTTSSSMREAERIIRQRFGMTTSVVYLVSSANHVERVMRDALVAFRIGTKSVGWQESVTLVCIAAETNYGRMYVDDTIVRDLGD